MKWLVLTGWSALLACLAVSGWSPAADGPPPTKNKAFLKAVPQVSVGIEPSTVARGQTATLTLAFDLAPGWYTYPTEQPGKGIGASKTVLQFPPAGEVVFVGKLEEPPFKTKSQEGLIEGGGAVELRYLDGKVVWQHPLVVSPQAKPGELQVPVHARVIVCNQKGQCLLPENLKFDVPLTISDAPAVAVEDKYKDQIPGVGSPPSPAPPSQGTDTQPETSADGQEESPGGADKTGKGLLAFMLTGAIWGAISLLTPCVFPMIPITVSFFLKQSEKTHHRPIGMALTYSLTIVVVLTIGAVLLLSVFQAASQHWLTNLILGALFIFFALSLFGMYDITLPSGLANFTSSRQGQGGMAGTVFMALTFSIISFSCVAPFLGGFAALVPSFGNVMDMIRDGKTAELAALFGKLLLGALAFAVAFASPFFFLALFPSLLRTLPKSGSWMNTVKVVMGFLELAAAVKFLRATELYGFGEATLLTYELALGLYVALSLLCGLYLLGLFRLPHDDPPEHLGVPRMIVSLLFLGLGLYLLPGLFKLDAGQRQRPAGTVFSWLESFLLPDVSARHYASLAEGLKEGRDKKKLVFIDFTGVG